MDLFDARLMENRTMCVVGPTQSGKTTFVKGLIENQHLVFQKPPLRIIWYYGISQPELHNQLRAQNVIVRQGLPNANDIQEGDLIILDDLLQESTQSKEVSNMFTRSAHHKRCFIIFLSQNLFAKGKEARTQSLNTTYILLFKNPRDKSQIGYLARQLEPTKSKAIIEMYHQATLRPHGYLFIDCTQECAPQNRFRTNILPQDPQPMLLFRA